MSGDTTGAGAPEPAGHHPTGDQGLFQAGETRARDPAGQPEQHQRTASAKDTTDDSDDVTIGLDKQLEFLCERRHCTTSWHCSLSESSRSSLAAVPLIGHIAWHTDTESTCQQCSEQLPLLTQVLKFKVSTPAPEHHISGLNVLGSLIFVVCHGDCIQVFHTETGQHVRDLRLEGMHDIGCLEAVNSHTLVLAQDATLYIISLSQKHAAVSKVVKRTLPYWPSDITLSTAGDLVLTDPSHKSVQVFDKEFQKVEKIALPQAESEYPHCVVKTKDAFVVADANNTVAVTDRSGSQYRQVYGGSDQLSEPQHVVEDWMGRLLVCDSGNNRVQLLDSRAKFLTHLLSAEHGLQYPSRLFLDKDTGLLYVGQRDAVSVYKYEYKCMQCQTRCLDLTVQLTQLAAQ